MHSRLSEILTFLKIAQKWIKKYNEFLFKNAI